MNNRNPFDATRTIAASDAALTDVLRALDDGHAVYADRLDVLARRALMAMSSAGLAERSPVHGEQAWRLTETGQFLALAMR